MGEDRMSRRRRISPEEDAQETVERTYVVLRDGTKKLLSTQVHPANPLHVVVYNEHGIPLPYTTVIERRRLELERKNARILMGGSLGRRRGRETKRDNAARANEALLVDVRAHRAKHSDHGRPAIAEALLAKHGREIDLADPAARKKAIAALVKRIERLEKKLLDT